MTYITDEEDVAREWVIRLQRWKSVRERCSIQTARRLVATDTGISAGTIENIIRGRSKGIRQWLFERLRTAVMIELQKTSWLSLWRTLAAVIAERWRRWKRASRA